MIVQNVSADGATTDLTFTVPAADYERATAVLGTSKAAIGYERIDGATDVAKVSVIGIGMRSHAGVAQTQRVPARSIQPDVKTARRLDRRGRARPFIAGNRPPRQFRRQLRDSRPPPFQVPLHSERKAQ